MGANKMDTNGRRWDSSWIIRKNDGKSSQQWNTLPRKVLDSHTNCISLSRGLASTCWRCSREAMPKLATTVQQKCNPCSDSRFSFYLRLAPLLGRSELWVTLDSCIYCLAPQKATQQTMQVDTTMQSVSEARSIQKRSCAEGKMKRSVHWAKGSIWTLDLAPGLGFKQPCCRGFPVLNRGWTQWPYGSLPIWLIARVGSVMGRLTWK